MLHQVFLSYESDLLISHEKIFLVETYYQKFDTPTIFSKNKSKLALKIFFGVPNFGGYNNPRFVG